MTVTGGPYFEISQTGAMLDTGADTSYICAPESLIEVITDLAQRCVSVIVMKRIISGVGGINIKCLQLIYVNGEALSIDIGLGPVPVSGVYLLPPSESSPRFRVQRALVGRDVIFQSQNVVLPDVNSPVIWTMIRDSCLRESISADPYPISGYYEWVENELKESSSDKTESKLKVSLDEIPENILQQRHPSLQKEKIYSFELQRSRNRYI